MKNSKVQPLFMKWKDRDRRNPKVFGKEAKYVKVMKGDSHSKWFLGVYIPFRVLLWGNVLRMFSDFSGSY